MKKGGQSMQGSQTRNIYAGRRVQAPAGSYRRPSAAQTARGKREKQRSRLERRRMLQVTVSAAILVIVVVVKLAMPDVLNRCRTQLLALMGEDTDFVAAFSAVGRAVSGDGSVGSALNDAYTAVFGPSHADDPAEEPANDPAQTGAEEETPPAEDGAPVYSSANTPAQVCLLQQQLGFAYAAPVAGEVTSAFGLRTHPLDGEERVIKKNPTGGFFRKKSDNIKSPDELLAGGSAAETKSAAPVSPAAAPSAPVKPVTVEADDFDLPPFDTAPSAPAPVVPAPAPVMHTPFAAPTPSVQSAPVAAAAAATTVPAVLTDKQEDKLRRAEVDAAREEVTREIEGGDAQPQPPAYQYPPITLLKEGSVTNAAEAGAELRNNSRRLAQTLTSFGVDAQPGDVVRGPSVTRYEFTLSQGVKLSKITNLQDDIALALGASGVRIAPIPDKISVVGVEVPNKLVSPVSIRTVLESTEFTTHPSTTAFAVGKDISGKNIVGNISKLPHVLIAGTTGSGKSVCTNSLIVSMLYKSTPEEVRFIMVDPKMVELAPYNGIPHLLIPVVTDPKKAAGALQWAVYEMMKRYKMFSEHNVKDLASYNKVAETDETLKKLPSVVVVIDELADLMLVAAKEVEESICRVAQMGRAAGMHLVIATQRPSADVITGLMKANIPSRIAFAVASAMESRIILDTAGAEKLVGRGDMLYAPLGEGKPKRVQGCFISSEEIERVVNFVKENGETDYDESVIDKINAAVAEKEKGNAKSGGNAPSEQSAADEGDEMLPAAIDVVMETGQASVSMLQRRLKLGYSRAARIVDEMETRGIVGPFEGSKPRQILITKEQWLALKMKGAYGLTPPEEGELPPPEDEA